MPRPSADIDLSFSERFYAPAVLEKKPQMYPHPVYPKTDVEINAVVSHINNPADFYIQVVPIFSV